MVIYLTFTGTTIIILHVILVFFFIIGHDFELNELKCSSN